MAQERRRRVDPRGPIQRDEGQDSLLASVPMDEERIRQRAYERYCERGCQDGNDMEDWLEAERLLRN